MLSRESTGTFLERNRIKTRSCVSKKGRLHCVNVKDDFGARVEAIIEFSDIFLSDPTSISILSTSDESQLTSIFGHFSECQSAVPKAGSQKLLHRVFRCINKEYRIDVSEMPLGSAYPGSIEIDVRNKLHTMFPIAAAEFASVSLKGQNSSSANGCEYILE